MKRRNVLKGLAMIPLAGTVLGKESVLAETIEGNRSLLFLFIFIQTISILI